MIKLKTGMDLFKHIPCHGVFHYVVIGIRQYADNVQYELECQTCQHGEKCKILVGGKAGKLAFIQVLNDEENEHYFWHNDREPFRFTKQAAQIDRVNSHIAQAKSNVEKAEQQLKQREEHLAKLMDIAELLEKEIKESANTPTNKESEER